MKTVTKRVEGTGKIPKYNMYPPLLINDTESFFRQIASVGFIVKDVEEKKLFPSQLKEIEEQKLEEKKAAEEELKSEAPVAEEKVEEVEESKPEARSNIRRNNRKPRQ